MAVPPLGAMAEAFFDYRQIKRSFYMFFFQMPMADAAVATGDLAFIEGLWSDWTGKGYDFSEDLAHVRDCLREPENLAAALGYYRALFDPSRQAPELSAEQAASTVASPHPTLYLHGTEDRALGAELVGGTGALLAAGSEVQMVEGANHFLHLEQPDTVNDRVLAFLGSAG